VSAPGSLAECRARTDVAELRELVAATGVQMRSATDPVILARVLDRVGNVAVAADAIAQQPRPAWLRELIGYDLMLVHRDG